VICKQSHVETVFVLRKAESPRGKKAAPAALRDPPKAELLKLFGWHPVAVNLIAKAQGQVRCGNRPFVNVLGVEDK
jgi:hypothetical protein